MNFETFISIVGAIALLVILLYGIAVEITRPKRQGQNKSCLKNKQQTKGV